MSGTEPPARRAPVLLEAWRLALGTLTVLPVRPPARVDAQVGRWAMLLAPVAALPHALVVVLAWFGVRSGVLPALVAAVLAVAGMAMLSGGLHLDGLADTVDGLAAAGKAGSAERGLDVMRRGDVGPLGAAAVTLVLVLDIACLAALFGQPHPVVPVAAAGAVLASRHALGWACRRGQPAARPGGLGAAVAGTVPIGHAALTGLLAAVIGWWVAAAMLPARPQPIPAGSIQLPPVAPRSAPPLVSGQLVPIGDLVVPVLVGLGPVLAALVAALVVGRLARRRLGGVTGDVLGATVELALAAALLSVTAILG